MSITISRVTNNQSFGTWLQRTNDIADIISTNVVTVDSTTGGSVTSGNSYVNGSFGVSKLFVNTALSGGNLTSNSTLYITSNLSVVDATAFFGNSSANVVLGFLSSPSSIQENFGNQNNYVQVTLNNTNSGPSSSSDYIAYNDVGGIDGLNYIDVGINSSNWSNTNWTINGAYDGYLYTGNGALSIGTLADRHINFFVGGTLAENEAMRIDEGANVGIGNTAPDAKLHVTGAANVSGNVTIGGALIGSNTLAVTGNAIFSNTIDVIGIANLHYNANVAGTLGVNGAVTIANTLAVGNTTVTGNLNVTALANVANLNTTTVNATANINASNTVTAGGGVFTANATVVNSVAFQTGSQGSTNTFFANSSVAVVGNSSVNVSITANSVTIGNPLDANPSNRSGTLTTYNMNVTGFISGAFSATGSILPSPNNNLVIGTSANTFNQIFVTNTYTNSISSFSGTLTVTDNTAVVGTLSVGNISNQYSGTYTFSGTALQTVDTFSINDFRSGEYLVELTDGTNYHLTKLLVLHDNGSAYVTEFGTLLSGSSLATFSVDIATTSFRLRAQPVSSGVVVKFTRTNLVL